MTSHRDRVLQAEPDAVWEILSDGWLYPLWVVGASRIREVDAVWPAAGARIHHSVGAWPLLLDDETQVLESVPGSLLVLRARVRPFGEATVRISVEAVGAGSRVSIDEDLSSGPGSWLPTVVRRPALDWRNSETLRRLAYLAERRPSGVALADRP
jgi:uncharacterized protein YndB with AHSA1/START domain